MIDRSKHITNTVTAKLYGLVGSPIEIVLGVALFEGLCQFYEEWSGWVYSRAEFVTLEGQDIPRDNCIHALVPQWRIERVGHVDFAVFLPALDKETPLVVIECDGHDFHEKTKEQASSDKKRDRELTKLNIPFLRFTGTDILHDAATAVSEIMEIVDKRGTILEDHWWIDVGHKINKPSQGGMYVPYKWPRMRRDRKQK